METLIITPSNSHQSDLIKSLLKEMNVSFDILSLQPSEEEAEVSEADMQSIRRGLQDVKNGKLTNEEQANKYFQDVLNQMDR